KRCDACKRPPAQGVFPEPSTQARNVPHVKNSEPVGAVKNAWPVIESQPALCHRYRRKVPLVVLIADGADSLAGAVKIPRPGIGTRHLERARKAAIQAPLHGVVGRISLAGANMSQTEVRMKTLPIQLPRVDICPGRQLMALRADIRTIEHDVV